MAGEPGLNVTRFERVARMWSAAGHMVRTPHEIAADRFQDATGRAFDPWRDNVSPGSALFRMILIADLQAVGESDALVLLDGWERSRFTRIEVLWAIALGKRLYDEHGKGIVRVPRVTFADPDALRPSDDALEAACRELGPDVEHDGPLG